MLFLCKNAVTREGLILPALFKYGLVNNILDPPSDTKI